MTATTYAVDGVSPSAVLTPSSADELAEMLRSADDRSQAIAPVGGGTQLDLGNPPRQLDLVLETARLDNIVEYEPADLTVTVEAGMRFDRLQALLAEQGQLLALDPPALDGATIGGLVATNASGALRFAYGTARDLVIGIRVANADGALTRAGGRVVKNVAGYDLTKLYIGSLGTLGVIVEMSFKLAPIPPAWGTVVGQFEALDDARTVLEAIVRSPLSPLAVELLGPRAAALAGLPPDVSVVLRLGGYPQAVERQARDLSALLMAHGGRCQDVPPSLWEDLARSRVQHRGALLLKAAAPIASSTALVRLLEDHLEESTVWAHAGNGVAYAACGGSPSATALLDLRERVRALGSNASLVVQRCPTELKAEVDVWGDPGSSAGLMRALKAKLDPRATLNPGRYVAGI